MLDSLKTSGPDVRRGRPWLLWLIVLGAWTGIGLVALGQGWVASETMGKPPPGFRQVLGTLQSVWLWALMTPAIFAACERFPLEQPSWRRNIFVHLALCLFLWGVDGVVGFLFAPWVGRAPMPFLQRVMNVAFICVFSYVAVMGVGHALRFHRLYVERRVRTAEVESQLLRAQLLALQMQLRPHFLFNALNTITNLIRTGDSREAIQMTAGLADLLRAVLRSDGTQEVSLSQELDFVERYLRIEQLRFQERLRTRIHVTPEASDALVPHLLLQPLVENAVRHGARTCAAENQVDIQVSREADMLWLRVRDNGEGPAASAPPEPGVPEEGGIGLSNTRARLRHLYGDAHRLELLPAEGGGALVQVAIPFRRAGSEAAR